MIQFLFVKGFDRRYSQPNSLRIPEEEWTLLYPLLSEIWGRPRMISFLLDFLDQEVPKDDSNCTGFDCVYVVNRGDGFVAIGHDFVEDCEFLFPKEQFKQFLRVLDKTSEELYPMSIYDSPDLLQFIIDNDWNTRIEQVYLSADTSFLEKNEGDRLQFRLARVKGYQYELVENDCVVDPISKTLGIFVEDVWALGKEQGLAFELVRKKERGRFDYERTYFEKDGDTVQLIRKSGSGNATIIFTADQMYRIIGVTRQFCINLHRTPLDKLPGVIFFTFDEYWNLIPVPLFRPADKNFVDKE